jgi:ATP-binding cassette subfamily F protein uup
MALIGMRDVCWGLGGTPLIENINFQIEKGERVGLVGRNGVGKSTLLKLLCGDLPPDSGDIWRQQGVTAAALEQDVPEGFEGTVFDIIARGFGDTGNALVEHSHICKQPEGDLTRDLASRRDELQHMLDAAGGWPLLTRIESILSRTRLDSEHRFADLSAGMKRRTLFARALVREPDILLLDEPTNHLDIDTIIWMEDTIRRHVKTLLFVTHDRAFLKKTASRIFELDRGRVVSYDCNYETYLKRRQAAFDAEEKQNAVFDKKLSQEETWIRQGIKARRTRNEGRVRVLKKMRAAFQARRRKIGNVNLQTQESERSGKLVIETKAVNFSYADVPIVRDFSTVIMRGDKVGIIGPNGVGKTTLLNILFKQIEPDTGRVRHGTRLQVAYFDQLRARLDEQKSVRNNIVEGNDFIDFNGQKRHIISYLQDFLFSPERCRTPVHVLSGGEKNRLLLAKLFTNPANVLVLDEPTNDLDAETLELLEELLFEYKGTLLLVSHDRAFLYNVVTSTIVFEENGRLGVYAGGYDDWLIQRPRPAEASSPAKTTAKTVRLKPKSHKPQKLGYMQERELEELPRRIDTLELKQKELFEAMSDPQFYTRPKEEMARVKAQLKQVEHDIEAAYSHWEELDGIKDSV